MKVYGQLENAQVEILSSAPASPETGRQYYDTSLGLYRLYNGSTWINLPSYSGRVVSVDSTTTLSIGEQVVLVDVDTPAADITITLPDAADVPGSFVTFIMEDTDNGASPHAVTIDPPSGDLLDGGSGRDFTQYQRAYTVVSDGSNWYSVIPENRHRVAGVGTTPFTLDARHEVILADPGSAGGPMTINLPPTGVDTVFRYQIKNLDASSFSVTVEPDGSETIDGASNYVLNTTNECIDIVSGSSGNWYIVGAYLE